MMTLDFEMPLAIGVRFTLGVALLVAAPESLTPKVFFVFGYLSLIASIALPLIGSQKVIQLVQWIQKWQVYTVRSWLVFGAAFDAYLIYAIVL
jgi:hypothetical protein